MQSMPTYLQSHLHAGAIYPKVARREIADDEGMGQLFQVIAHYEHDDLSFSLPDGGECTWVCRSRSVRAVHLVELLAKMGYTVQRVSSLSTETVRHS